jgi:DNA-directed RNA polymerase specialized sigma24 family protein
MTEKKKKLIAAQQGAGGWAARHRGAGEVPALPGGTPVTPEELQAAAQGAARAYRARYSGSQDDWPDLVQEGLLALLLNRKRLAVATTPGLAFTIAYRAICHSQQKRRTLEAVQSGFSIDFRTPEQVAMVREVMRAAQRVRQPKHVPALLAGASAASVARRGRVTIGTLYNALWEYRRNVAQQPEVKEWMQP